MASFAIRVQIVAAVGLDGERLGITARADVEIEIEHSWCRRSTASIAFSRRAAWPTH